MNGYVRIADPEGVQLALVSDFAAPGQASLQYTLNVGQVGALRVTLPVGFDDSKLRLDGRISVWRVVGSRLPYRDGDAEYLIRRWDYGEEQTTVIAQHANSLMKTRIVNYFAGTTFTSKTGTPADDLIKEFVSQQMGSGISSADRQGVETQADLSTWLSIQSDLSDGPSTGKAASWRYLFDVVREICDDSTEAGTYLTAEIVSDGAFGLQLRTYTGQRGVDRRVSSGQGIIFSLDQGNLANAILSVDRTEEITFATGGGMGEGTARVIQTALDSTRMGESVFNRREAFTELTNSNNTSQILAIAQAKVRSGRPKIFLTGEVVETPRCIRGVHFDIGDYVTIEHRGQRYDARLDVLDESWSPEGRKSRVQFRVNI